MSRAGAIDLHGLSSGWWRALWPPVAAWAVLVAASAGAWTWTGSLQRAEADRGLVEHSQITADFTHSYVLGTATRQQRDATTMLGRPTVTRRELELFASGFGYAVRSVFDDRGRRLVSIPTPGARERQELPAPAPMHSALRRNRIEVSGVHWSPLIRRPSVAIAVPFPTPYGRRVFIGGFVVSQSPLGDYVDHAAMSVGGGSAFHLDQEGVIVASSDRLGERIRTLAQADPPLAAALRRDPGFGRYRKDGVEWTYSAFPVRSTSWQAVLAAPDRHLYDQAADAQRRLGAMLTAGSLIALAGALALGVATRRRRGAELQSRRLTTELKAANAELDAFSANVAHDLRAPLTVISAVCDILIDEADGLSAQESGELLAKVRSHTVKMIDLITSLLRFSHVQRQPLITEPVDMAAIVRTAWDSLAVQRADRDFQLRIDRLPPCQGDPNLLQQVIVNLLSNAVKFTRDRPIARIHVSGRPGPHGCVTYEISDNGAGFDPGQADKLFQPFARLHSPDSFHGIGIGLSLVQRIIIRHHGQVWAYSTPGQGATFRFSLPGPRSGRQPAHNPTGPPADGRDGGGDAGGSGAGGGSGGGGGAGGDEADTRQRHSAHRDATDSTRPQPH